MRLYRLQIRPLSPWRTPWQADTLTGLLLATCARNLGEEILRTQLIEPMQAGKPPFVLSDAFPRDLLPLPALARLQHWPADHHKQIKRAKWITPAGFAKVRRGENASLDDVCTVAPIASDLSRHNTLDRDNDSSLEGQGPFARLDYYVNDHHPGADYLTIYIRVHRDALELLGELFDLLSQGGFGADVATGRGQFTFVSGLEPVSSLEGDHAHANGLICLSTFQPASGDPTDGCWETFAKFAKLGPDLGLEDVRKNTLIMFRPGACFQGGVGKAFLGRALPMDLVLPPQATALLRDRAVNMIHPAFGLALSASLSP